MKIDRKKVYDELKYVSKDLVKVNIDLKSMDKEIMRDYEQSKHENEELN